MSSIHYTNAVLTIIALALSVIAVENIVRPSHYTNAVLTIIALVLSVIAVENIEWRHASALCAVAMSISHRA